MNPSPRRPSVERRIHLHRGVVPDRPPSSPRTGRGFPCVPLPCAPDQLGRGRGGRRAGARGRGRDPPLVRGPRRCAERARVGSLLRRRTFPTWEGGGWSLVTLIVLLIVLVIPLTALRAHQVGYDGAVTWTARALLYSLATSSSSPACRIPRTPIPITRPWSRRSARLELLLRGEDGSHPRPRADSVAQRRSSRRHRNWSDEVVPAGHNAGPRALHCLCGTHVPGGLRCGRRLRPGELCSGRFCRPVVVSGCRCCRLVGACAAPTRRNLMVAWSCAIVASLTKNEGLVTAIAILADRVFGISALLSHDASGQGDRRVARCCGVGGDAPSCGSSPPCPASSGRCRSAPSASMTPSSEDRVARPTALRASATADAVARRQVVLPVALVIATLGCFWFLQRRRRAHLANPAWLWVASGCRDSSHLRDLCLRVLRDPHLAEGKRRSNDDLLVVGLTG